MNKQLADKIALEAKGLCDWFKITDTFGRRQIELALLRIAEKAHEAGEIAAREEGIY